MSKNSKMMVSVIIPAYNESENIAYMVQELTKQYPKYEIIVVDDGSSDNTGEIAERAGAIVIRHPYNIGNGAAIKTGIRKAKGDVLVFMDGDGQHQPKDIKALLIHIKAYDMVVGARTNGGQSSFARALANRFYNWLATYVTSFRVLDLTSGFRAVKAQVARTFLYLLPNTYSYPSTLTLGVLRSGRSLIYVPIMAKNRKSGASKIKLFQDGPRFFLIIVKICTLFSPMRIFLPISFTIFMTGFVYYMYTFIAWHRFTNMSALCILTSIIVFLLGLVSEQICQMRFDKSD